MEKQQQVVQVGDAEKRRSLTQTMRTYGHGARISYLLILIVTFALVASYFLGYIPLFIAVIYIILSSITYLVYAKDKSAAKNDMWRVPESTLHTLSLFGGWPGAKIAQLVLRHKTSKISFRITYWITVVANCGALAWLHTKQGSIYLNTFTFNVEELVINEISSSNVKAILLNLLSFHA